MFFLKYILFRIFTYPLAFFSYSALHRLGRILGSLLYIFYPKYRKRALTNLALATDLHLSPEGIEQTAKESLQNLAITFLEYPKLAREKKICRIAHCENPEIAEELLKSGKGVIFFCGHLAHLRI